MTPPDFEQIARMTFDDFMASLGKNHQPPCTVVEAMAAALRQAWNARGAADAEAVDAVFRSERHSLHNYLSAIKEKDE